MSRQQHVKVTSQSGLDKTPAYNDELKKQNQNQIFNAISEGILLINENGHIVDANPAAEKMFGYPKTEMLGQSPLFLMQNNSPFAIQTILHEVKRHGNWEGELVFQRGDGAHGMCYTMISPLYDSVVSGISAIVVSRDVTENKKIEQALRQSEMRFRNAFEHAAIGMALVAPDGRFLQVNCSYCKIVGYTENELQQITFMDITHPEDLEEDRAKSQELLSGSIDFFQIEKRYIHKLGHTIWTLLTASILRDDEGNPFHFIAQVQDITARKTMEEDLRRAVEEAKQARLEAEKLAYTDYLTDLLNRRAFLDLLNVEISRAKRYSEPLSVLIADIDHFKRINDTYGHQAGDVCLKEFAGRLSNLCRQYDHIGRYGGEEFIICLPRTSTLQSLEIAERMRQAVQDEPIRLSATTKVKLTSSFGVSVYHPVNDVKTVDTLIAQADEALYKAKAQGRNRVNLFRLSS